MVGKKKKAQAAKAAATIAKKASRRGKVGMKEERRARKLEKRRKEKKTYTAEMWAAPAPSHLIAKLDIPKVKSKYQSYFEFAENTEKKKKKLEFTVTDDPNPPPGFAFVPIGDPAVTNACKELSRERDAMIFIVSNHKEENSKISEHMYRTGYHFREVIVDEAREIVGETIISKPAIAPGFIEPIPESQDEINKQADGAIRDLFPRIPNTDRTMIIEHAFKKGALFHGEPTVGLQANIPLSRRVQLAVLAHIRHTHTRYDKLLRETTWMNARKVVEPVCLDVLVKWRGDEETGRDQMDEILREVVIITDSEEEDESSDEESSDEEGEVTSSSSTEGSSEPSTNQQRPIWSPSQARPASGLSQGLRDTGDFIPVMPARTGGMAKAQAPPRDKKAQRGFKRYQAAWDEALHRKQGPSLASGRAQAGTPSEAAVARGPRSAATIPIRDMSLPLSNAPSRPRPSALEYNGESPGTHHGDPIDRTQSGQYYLQPRPVPSTLMHRDEVIIRPLSERPTYYQDAAPSFVNPSHQIRESRPPQVVRASPTKHGLQDMLLPSIETASSDVPSPRIEERSGIYSGWEQESYPRRVTEHGRHSPEPRQVIVINDDSPQAKRRRVVHEDNSGRFRLIPSRDHSHHIQPQRSDSPMKSTPPVQPGDYLPPRPRVPSQSTQGLSKETQTHWIRSTGNDRLPVYDAPETGFFTEHPSHLGRPDVGYGSTHGAEPRIVRHQGSPQQLRENAHDNFYQPRPVNEFEYEHVRMAEPDHGFRQAAPDYSRADHFQRPSSPKFPVLNRVSRSYDTDTGSVVADQDFIHSFSQSRLDDPLRPNDGFTVLAERSHPTFVTQNSHPQGYENHSVRSFATVPSVRARSPVQHMERPMQYREGPRQPIYTQQPIQHHATFDGSSTTLRDRQMTPAGAEQPIYVRTIDPRRKVIIIE